MEEELKNWVRDALAPGVWVVEEAECAESLHGHFGIPLTQMLQPFCNLLCQASRRRRLSNVPILGPRLAVDLGVRLYDRSKPPTTLDDLVDFLRTDIPHSPQPETELHPPSPLSSAAPTSNKFATAKETHTLLSRCNAMTELVSRNHTAVSSLLGVNPKTNTKVYPYWVEETWDWICHLAGQNTAPICVVYAVKADQNVVDRVRGLSTCEPSELLPMGKLYLAVEIRDASLDVKNALQGAEALNALQAVYPPEWCRLLSLTVSSSEQSIEPSPRWLMQAKLHNVCPKKVPLDLPPLPVQSLTALQSLGESLILDFCLPALQIRKRTLEFQSRQIRRGFRSQVKAYFSTTARAPGTTRKSDEALNPLLQADAPSQVLTALGSCYFSTGEFDRSLEHCKTAIVDAKLDRSVTPPMAYLTAAAASLLLSARQSGCNEMVNEPELVRDAVNWLAQLCANHTTDADPLMSTFYRVFTARVCLILATHSVISPSVVLNERSTDRALKFLEVAVVRLTEIRLLLETPSSEASSLTRCYLRGVSLTCVAMSLNCVAALLLCYPKFDRAGIKGELAVVLRNHFPSRAIEDDATRISSYLVDLRQVFPWAPHTYQASRQVLHFLYRSLQAYKASGFVTFAEWTADGIRSECLSVGCRLEGNVWRRGLGQWSGALELLQDSKDGEVQFLWAVLVGLRRSEERLPPRLEPVCGEEKQLSFCLPLLVSSRWLRRQGYIERARNCEAFKAQLSCKRNAFGVGKSNGVVGLETTSPRYRLETCGQVSAAHKVVPSFESLLFKFASSTDLEQLDQLVRNVASPSALPEAAARSTVKVYWVLFNPLDIALTLTDIRVSFRADASMARTFTDKIDPTVVAPLSVELFEADLRNFNEGKWTAEALHFKIEEFNVRVQEPLHGPPISFASRLLALWDGADFAGDGAPVSFVSPAVAEPKLSFRAVSTGQTFPFTLFTHEVAECTLDWSPDFQPTVVAIATSSNLHLHRIDLPSPNLLDSKVVWQQGQRKARFHLFAIGLCRAKRGECLIRMAAVRQEEGGSVEAFGLDFVSIVEDAVLVSSSSIVKSDVCALTVCNLRRDTELFARVFLLGGTKRKAAASFAVRESQTHTEALTPAEEMIEKMAVDELLMKMASVVPRTMDERLYIYLLVQFPSLHRELVIAQPV